MIEECCDSWDIYMKFKHPLLRPFVRLPLASRFSQIVCMDLKEHVHNESWIVFRLTQQQGTLHLV